MQNKVYFSETKILETYYFIKRASLASQNNAKCIKITASIITHTIYDLTIRKIMCDEKP